MFDYFFTTFLILWMVVDVVSYFKLYKENDKLREENFRLKWENEELWNSMKVNLEDFE